MNKELFQGKAHDPDLKVRWKGNRDFVRLCLALAAMMAGTAITLGLASHLRPLALGSAWMCCGGLAVVAIVQFFRCLDGRCRYCKQRLDFDKEVLPRSEAAEVLRRVGKDPGPTGESDGNWFISAFECTGCRKFVVSSSGSAWSD